MEKPRARRESNRLKQATAAGPGCWSVREEEKTEQRGERTKRGDQESREQRE